eukprot:CAMPEP_0182875540 /NCGR_PEP_ID=MMETSP0034_2-20130328/13600_1 /TAXON_ID=156128 /ORGANISM="Nephroselmis pyriformis, Strain CCMP717" /LENGTH=101 /DNA_ID=CAMNT_0025008281 /DNA_START=596 /DNA_END=902 /DNA_ORIENTATION=-
MPRRLRGVPSAPPASDEPNMNIQQEPPRSLEEATESPSSLSSQARGGTHAGDGTCVAVALPLSTLAQGTCGSDEWITRVTRDDTLCLTLSLGVPIHDRGAT